MLQQGLGIRSQRGVLGEAAPDEVLGLWAHRLKHLDLLVEDAEVDISPAASRKGSLSGLRLEHGVRGRRGQEPRTDRGEHTSQASRKIDKAYFLIKVFFLESNTKRSRFHLFLADSAQSPPLPTAG